MNATTSQFSNVSVDDYEEFIRNLVTEMRGEEIASYSLEASTTSDKTFTVLPTIREWTHSLKGPLLSRGWTLQERELSCRVLHYTADRVVWECRESYASEDDPRQEQKSMVKDIGLKFRLLDGTAKDRKNRPYNYKFSKWMDLVEEYSCRKLSTQDDKLRAIAGLAEAIKPVQVDDVYMSGLWKRDLLQELMWRTFPANQQQTYPPENWPPAPVSEGIPTWSWAAYDSPVVFDRLYSPSGEVAWRSSATRAAVSILSFFGPALEITLSEEQYDFQHLECGSKHYRMSSSEIGCTLCVSFDAEPESLPKTVLQCVVVGLRHSSSDARQNQDGLPTYLESSSSSYNQVSYSITTLHSVLGTYSLPTVIETTE